MTIRDYAITANGLFGSIIGKISALTVFHFLTTNGIPTGRIEYALNHFRQTFNLLSYGKNTNYPNDCWGYHITLVVVQNHKMVSEVFGWFLGGRIPRCISL